MFSRKCKQERLKTLDVKGFRKKDAPESEKILVLEVFTACMWEARVFPSHGGHGDPSSARWISTTSIRTCTCRYRCRGGAVLSTKPQSLTEELRSFPWDWRGMPKMGKRGKAPVWNVYLSPTRCISNNPTYKWAWTGAGTCRVSGGYWLGAEEQMSC